MQRFDILWLAQPKLQISGFSTSVPKITGAMKLDLIVMSIIKKKSMPKIWYLTKLCVGIYLYLQSVNCALMTMLCDFLEKFGVLLSDTLTKLRTIYVKKKRNENMFLHEKSLAKGPYVKAETKTLKATRFFSSILYNSYPSHLWLDLLVRHVTLVQYSHKLRYMINKCL